MTKNAIGCINRPNTALSQLIPSMNTSTLIRGALPLPATQATELTDEQVFRRRVIATTGHISDPKDYDIRTSVIRDTFAELGIYPFTEDSVTAFKQRKIDELDGPSLAQHESAVAQTEKENIPRKRVQFGIVMTILAGWISLFWIRKDPGEVLFLGFFLGFIFTPIFLKIIYPLKGKPDRPVRYYWQTSRIDEYSQNLPEDIELICCRIKERLPACEIFIHRCDLDPFVSVRFGSHEYYVAHFDEPAFEGERTVV